MRELVLEYQRTGDRSLLNEILAMLTRPITIVASKIIAAGTVNGIVSIDDLVAVGLAAAWEAIEKFDPERGTQPQTIIIAKARWRMLDELRQTDWYSRSKRKQIERAGEAPVQVRQFVERENDDATKSTSAALLALGRELPPPEVIGWEEMPDWITRGLSAVHREMLHRYFYREETMKEIAVALDLSESRVSQVMSKLLLQLREFGKEAQHENARRRTQGAGAPGDGAGVGVDRHRPRRRSFPRRQPDGSGDRSDRRGQPGGRKKAS